MALETKNRDHAGGSFVPVPAPPFDSQVLNSWGVASFTRNSAGNYTVELLDAIGFADGKVETDLPANFLGFVGGSISEDGATVLLTAFDFLGAPVDPPFIGFSLKSVIEGEGVGPAAPLPAPPVVPSVGSSLLGWARISAAGAIVAQSTSAVLAGAPALPLIGQFDYTLNVATLAAVHAQIESIPQPASNAMVIGSTPTGPSTATVVTFNQLGSPLARDHAVFFYSL